MGLLRELWLKTQKVVGVLRRNQEKGEDLEDCIEDTNNTMESFCEQKVTPKACFQCKNCIFKKLCIDARFYGCSNSCTKKENVKKQERKKERKEEQKFCTVRSIQLLLTVKVPHSEFLFLGISP